jgi:hypothetical protein
LSVISGLVNVLIIDVFDKGLMESCFYNELFQIEFWGGHQELLGGQMKTTPAIGVVSVYPFQYSSSADRCRMLRYSIDGAPGASRPTAYIKALRAIWEYLSS